MQSPWSEYAPLFALGVVLPVVLVWRMRDAIRRWHVGLMVALTAVAAVVGRMAWSVLPEFRGSLGGAVPAVVLIGAVLLGVPLLVAALTGAVVLATRDPVAHARRESAFAASGEPRRPSFAPLSAREREGQFIQALAGLSAVFAFSVMRGLRATEVQNYLRIVPVFRRPGSPYQLSWAATPGLFALQVGIGATIAIVAGVTAWKRYQPYRRSRTAYR